MLCYQLLHGFNCKVTPLLAEAGRKMEFWVFPTNHCGKRKEGHIYATVQQLLIAVWNINAIFILHSEQVIARQLHGLSSVSNCSHFYPKKIYGNLKGGSGIVLVGAKVSDKSMHPFCNYWHFEMFCIKGVVIHIKGSKDFLDKVFETFTNIRVFRYLCFFFSFFLL